MKKLLKRYQERLADLSRRNRSIRLARVVKRRSFDLASLAALDKDLPGSVVHTLTLRGRSATLLKAHARDKKSEALLESIHLLRRHLEATFKETGAQEGYLGYPFVQGTFKDGTFFRCPLILYPVTIDYTPQGKSIQLKPQDRKPLLNKTFLLAFNKYNKPAYGVDLKRLDAFEDLSPDELVPWALALLKDAGVDVTAPTGNPSVLPIPDLLKDDYPVSEPHSVTVLPYAVIGDFSQANSALSADYDALIDSGRMSPVAELVIGASKEKMPSTPEPLVDPPERESHFLARPDASQEQVLVAARSGPGIVVHGPPGTGKSEVITNLVADCLVRGEKVLVVCEKRAALDVVKNRLGKGGIERYAVLVHDAEADRAEVFARIAENLEAFEKKRSSAVVVRAEDEAKRIDTRIASLQEHVQAFAKDVHGVPLHELYARSRKDGPRLKIPIAKIPDEEVRRLATRVSALQREGERFDTGLLAHRKPFPASFDHKEFLSSLRPLVKALRALENAYQGVKDEAPRRSLFDLPGDYTRWRADREKGARFVFPSWWTIGRVFEKHSNAPGFTARWDSFVQASEAFDPSFVRERFTPDALAMIEKAVLRCESGSALLDAVIRLGDDLDAVATFDHVKSSLTTYERTVYDACVHSRTPDWSVAIVNTFSLAWIESAETGKALDAPTYERLRAEIVKALAARDALTPRLVEELLAEQYKRVREDGNVQPLLHEVQKQRRKPTIRTLCEQFLDRGLLELFPCWLCSPETASAIFPLKPGLFDVIVYDEASQLRLERAIPSLVRAQRVVVAGDEKQLPPSSFFDTVVDEEEDETIEEEARQALEDESLLVRSKYALPGHTLLHHYRSRRAELIDFSNKAFYNDALRIVPRSDLLTRPAITYTNVHGTWSENTNMKEARHVVKLVKELLRSAPSKTYGVITFNYKQRELIEDLLDDEAAADSAFGKALAAARTKTAGEEDVSLFVKNIENVQGDERDVIIFSVAYARDAAGKLRHQFGPLNGVYGGNRLNVAVTRAREAIHVVCSLEPTDLHYNGTFEGPRRLQEYLTYCKRVSEGERTTLRTEEKTSTLATAVSAALQALGHTVVMPVGAYGYSISIGIQHPKKKQLVVGIECEDETYHAVRGAKERDIYRQRTLERSGWTILRVFSRDWWNNPEGEARRLDREIKKLL